MHNPLNSFLPPDLKPTTPSPPIPIDNTLLLLLFFFGLRKLNPLPIQQRRSPSHVSQSIPNICPRNNGDGANRPSSPAEPPSQQHHHSTSSGLSLPPFRATGTFLFLLAGWPWILQISDNTEQKVLSWWKIKKFTADPCLTLGVSPDFSSCDARHQMSDP
ncbi:predicted protein [Histoplasma capsulatum H143]|uniref:Uncharacterized protein n=1 Tax=Ajellomyces capsulatus (strain H143) TaxID=544712 RepID=C6H3G9_AJECH|nr:predicted protein [Histoplasma capsulatum H143]